MHSAAPSLPAHVVLLIWLVKVISTSTQSFHPPTHDLTLTFLSFGSQLNLEHQLTYSCARSNFYKHHSFARIPFARRTSPHRYPIPSRPLSCCICILPLPHYTSAHVLLRLSPDHSTLACASITTRRQTVLQRIQSTAIAH